MEKPASHRARCPWPGWLTLQHSSPFGSCSGTGSDQPGPDWNTFWGGSNTGFGHRQATTEQSRAEQSRAEQSRAEQSRAEQSRAEQSRSVLLLES
jgi:hypothetical protein